MSIPILSLQNVTRRYRAGVAGCMADVRALADVTLEVARGECVGICGAPGAGKSTLLLCAAGLLPPDTGRVTGARAAYVPFHGVTHPFLSVRASLEFTASLRELEQDTLTGEPPDCDALLQRTGLQAVADMRLGQLTAGMRARAELAHALLDQPQILCLDDPLSRLDPSERRRYGAVLAELCASALAIILTARDPLAFDTIVSRRMILRDGRLMPLPAGAVAPRRLLELEVGVPAYAMQTLSAYLPSVTGRDRAVRVPLESLSAEDILSTCLALGIRVYGSRVVTASVGRVAEGKEPGY